MNSRNLITIIFIVLGLAAVVFFASGCGDYAHDGDGHGGMHKVGDGQKHDSIPTAKAGEEDTFYTCPMHPNVHGEKDGKCPECGMKLVEKKAKKQTVCPAEMGGEINKKVYADYDGLRVYFCCPGCIEEFKKDPDKLIKKLRDAGVEPETAPKK